MLRLHKIQYGFCPKLERLSSTTAYFIQIATYLADFKVTLNLCQQTSEMTSCTRGCKPGLHTNVAKLLQNLS